jgi:cell wall-associated NlpC family hydrolase
VLLPAGAVSVLLGSVVSAPLLLTAAGLGGAAAGQALPSVTARADIPAALLPHYQQAPACDGLPWQVIAAIGAIESDHARHGGARLDPGTGLVSPPILGPALDGGRFAAIRVPPGGSPWHEDASWDHAAGPMQFITATWAAWGLDASGDGVASPHNAYDAIATAGRYLCNRQPRLDSIHAAIGRYNPDDGYVAEVLARARAYGLASGGELPPAGNVAIATGPAGRQAAAGPVLHADASPVVGFAVGQLGKPYVWGGAGPGSYDCSGLVLAAYATVGVRLPHYAAYQATYGQPVDWRREPIRPGDLLFFRGGDPVHDHGHVGIALDAQRWINAPQAGDVVSVDPVPFAGLQAVRRLLLP